MAKKRRLAKTSKKAAKKQAHKLAGWTLASARAPKKIKRLAASVLSQSRSKKKKKKKKKKK